MKEQLQTDLMTRRIVVNGISLNVVIGPPNGLDLLLLHGIGSRWTSWWPVIDRLAPRARLIMPDWRGHGDSGQPESGYTFADYRSDLEALIIELDLSKPVVLGHSLGGIITMAALATDPSRFLAVILEDAPLRTTTASSSQVDEWLRLSEMTQADAAQVYRQQFPEWTIEECLRRAKSITSTHSGVFREIHNGVTDDSPIDWVEPLRPVQTPILLIHGDRDQGSLVDPNDITRFCSLVPAGSAKRVPGAGHSLHRDQTVEFMAHVDRFLGSLEPKGTATSEPHS